MKTLAVALAIGISAGTARGAEAPARGWLEGWRDATVAIGKRVSETVRGPDGKEIKRDRFVTVGTGVVMGLTSDPAKVPWLVTARHMFFDLSRGWEPTELYLRFGWFADRPVDEYLGVRLELVREGKRLWLSPGSGVDLACIALTMTPMEVGRAEVPYVPVEAFASADDLFEGAGVFALGYPASEDPKEPWSRITRPLLRHGIIAWVSPSRPEDALIVVDAAISPGNSGGPVFRVPSGVDRLGNFVLGQKVTFLGIATQMRLTTLPLVVGGGAAPEVDEKGKPNPKAQSPVGLGVVEPAARVRLLLERAVQLRGGRTGV